jgi:hypothetical protein
MTRVRRQNVEQIDLTELFDSSGARRVSIRGTLASRLDLPVELTCGRNYQREENG